MADTLGKLQIDLEARLAKFESDMGRAARLLQRDMVAASQRAERQMVQMRQSMERDMERVRSQADRVKSSLIGIFSVTAGVQFARQLAQVADGYSNIQAKLRLVTSDAGQLARVNEQVFAISQRTFSSLDSTATLVGRTTQALISNGAAADDALQRSLGLVETIQKAFAVSGATATESQNAIIQLSQGLAAGALRGEEFNSIAEQGPRIMRALADSLGVTTGKLRAMAAEGKLTAEVVETALTSQAQKIDAEFAKLPLTIERSLVLLRNEFTKYVGEADQASGASRKVAEAISDVARNLPAIISGFIAAAQVATAYFAIYRVAIPVLAAARAAHAAWVIQLAAGQVAMEMGIATATTWQAKMIAALRAVTAAGVAFFAGWQIGTWLRENFVEVRVAGLYLIDALLKGFERLKQGAEIAWEAIKAAALGAMNTIRGAIAGVLSSYADAAEFTDIFGIGAPAIAKVRELAAALRPTTDASEQFAAAVERINAETEQSIASIDQATSDLIEWEIANANNTAAITETTNASTRLNATLDAGTGVVAGAATEFDKLGKSIEKAFAADAELVDVLRDQSREMGGPLVAAAQKYAAEMLRIYEIQMRMMELGPLTAGQEQQLAAARANAAKEYSDALASNESRTEEFVEFTRNATTELQSIWLYASDGIGDALTTALFDGAEAGADAIKDVMQQLARDLVRFWLQQKIIIPLQERIVGANGVGGMQLGSGLGGVAMGGLIGYGATGSIGGTLGGAAGSWLGNLGATMATQAVASGALGSMLGSFLGSALPIVGTLLGSFLGNALGDLFGSDPKPRLRVNATGAGIGNIGTRGTTALGTLAFNADDLEDTRGTERQLLEAIQALDQGFVTLVNTFDLGQTQLDALRDAASRWSIDLRNSAITGEAVLGSRFGALLDTFDEHIVSFVGSAGTLEERMGRLTEALFIDAAAATGELVDDFDQLVELLDQFGREGEAVDVTYGRLLQSTRLLEDALGMMGQNLDLSREAFVAFAAEIADAAGGLEQATALWSSYFETFYSEQERAELLVARASQQAAEQFADIGLAVEDFMGSSGLADFRALFERELPNLTAEQVVQWLEAANALGFFGEASAALAEILARAAAEAGAATAAFTALASAVKPEGPGGLDFGNINPGLPDPYPTGPYIPNPAGPVLTTGMPWWMSPGARLPDGSIVPDTGIGADLDREIDRRYERELDWLRRLADLQDSLLLDEQLTTLTPAQRLAEIERQYQTAFTGALGGDEAAREIYDELARQFADIGRGFFGSSAGYDELFARILADIGTLRAASPATTAASVVNTALTNSTPPPAAAAQGDQIAALRADFAAAMDQLVTIGERQVQLETRIANATEVTAQNTGTPLFQQRTIG